MIRRCVCVELYTSNKFQTKIANHGKFQTSALALVPNKGAARKWDFVIFFMGYDPDLHKDNGKTTNE